MNRTRCAWQTLWRPLTLLATILLVQACTTVPFEYPREPSQALASTPATLLGTFAENWTADNAEQSGFLSLPDGIDALGARLRLIENAQQSIDAQYFIVKKDRAGALFAGKLLLAADRGVRVRFLVDDIFSPGLDSPLTLLNSHPNIQVRLFNPVSRNSLRYWGMLLDFKRANRRMHNKSFTVDGSIGIVGGRNIGEEYFELKQDVKFDDFEVMAVGPVIGDIAEGFDAYWNSTLSVPVEAFGKKVRPEQLDDWRKYINQEMAAARNGIYAPAINSAKVKAIWEQSRKFNAAKATVVIDPPAKLSGRVGDTELATLAAEFVQRFRMAKREIIIVTPYFIPQQAGTQLLREIVAQGVRVIIVTNSLASTNHVPVHSRYQKYRRALLQAGVEFYEMRADQSSQQSSEWGLSPERVTLHSKATVIDRQTIFVGSLNFDPRSLLLNTEMGLFVESPTLGSAFAKTLMESLSDVTYRVALDSEGAIRWYWEPENGTPEVSTSEPLASLGRRLLVKLYRFVPIEGQL